MPFLSRFRRYLKKRARGQHLSLPQPRAQAVTTPSEFPPSGRVTPQSRAVTTPSEFPPSGRVTPQPGAVTTPSEFPPSGRVTIGGLSDSVLLNIFHHYLDVSPRDWPRLVHICRRWRRVVFASQQALHIRLSCTYGTPVLRTLDCWPSLDIAVQYGGSESLAFNPPAPDDEDNIMAALKQSGRVSSIGLTVTSSLLGRLSSIEGPFSELEDLILLSRDGVRLVLPSAFRWGTRLRCLHSTRVAIPGLLQLLYSSTTLVDLQLHEVFDYWEFPPEALTNALSETTRLRSLSVHFLSTVDHPALPPQSCGHHGTLPDLTRFSFRGNSWYLERLVAQIDTPRLEDIEVAFSNKNIISFPKLRRFINRIKLHKPYRRAHILSSDRAISISLIQPEAPACLKLQLFCESSSEQLLFVTRVCVHLSASLFKVEDLRISTTRSLGRGDSDYSGWRELLNSFTGVKWFHLDWDHSTNIVWDLQLSDRRYKAILPSLHKLYVAQPGPRHAPFKLLEAIMSLMISRRFSGHHIAVEYERPFHVNKLPGTGPFSQQVTIEMLSDDILLNIFHHCLDLTPQIWPTLAFVCQRWRQIVFTSPLGLNLRLYCTYGTPVLKTLDYWPVLPIVLRYGGFPNLDPPAPEDDENIMAVLKQSGRVDSIRLTITSSLLGKLSAISEPFSELEELILLSRDDVRLTLPRTFRWGPRLRTLQSTRIAFPSVPQLLSPSHDLVDIRLHEIPSAGYFSPEAFANALSRMTNLRTLSHHFLSLPPRRNYLTLPPLSGERVVLPALASLRYRGTSKYLDSLVARIDAPGLGDIDVTFFSQPTMDTPQLGHFIKRTEMQTLLSRAEVQTSDDAISISFTGSGTSTPVRLQISSKQLDWQLSSMAQVCDQFSPFVFGIETLGINSTQSPSKHDDADGEQWREIFRPFGGARHFRVAGVHATDILRALSPADGEQTIDANVLTSVRNLRIQEPMALDGPLLDAAQLFTTSRRRLGSRVKLELSCSICGDSFGYPQFLKRHLLDQHAYRHMCFYCGDFECTPTLGHLFQGHLRSKHPEVARNDSLISKPFLGLFEPSTLIYRHSSLRAPESHSPLE